MKKEDVEEKNGNKEQKSEKSGNSNKFSISSNENFTINSQNMNYPDINEINEYQSGDVSDPIDIYKDYNKDPEHKKVAEKEAKNLDNYIKNFSDYKSAEDLINGFVNNVKSGTKDEAIESLGAIKTVCDGLSKFNQYFLNGEFYEGKFKNIKNKDDYIKKLQKIFKKDEKNGNKLAKDFAYKFPIWGIQLLDYIEKSNFAKRLLGKGNQEPDKEIKYHTKSKNIFHRIYKGFVHFFTGKEGKNKTITKVNNLLKKYSEPWAIFWVNYCDPEDTLSKDALINEMQYICQLRDKEFVSRLEDLNETPGFYNFFAEMNNPKSSSNRVYRESNALVYSMMGRIDHTNRYNLGIRLNIQKIIKGSGVKNISYSNEKRRRIVDANGKTIEIVEKTTNNFFTKGLSEFVLSQQKIK